MTEPINMDGFMDTLDMLKAIQGIKGRGARLYRHYARYKANAMRARLAGEIELALQQEQTCERIYNRLPTKLRW